MLTRAGAWLDLGGTSCEWTKPILPFPECNDGHARIELTCARSRCTSRMICLIAIRTRSALPWMGEAKRRFKNYCALVVIDKPT